MRRAATFREAISRCLRPARGRSWLAAGAALTAAALVAGLIWAASGHRGGEPRRDRRSAALVVRASSGSTGARLAARQAAPPQATRPPSGLPVDVGVDIKHPGAPVPSDFLGLSFEAADLPRIAGFARAHVLARLLGSLGAGTLRFGGVSADTLAAWSEGGALPRWASTAISARDLAAVATLARQIGWHVLLTVGLGHFDPGAAAREAATAHALLGPMLAGIEIGNEPDRYFLKGLRGPGWSFSTYRREVGTYRAHIARAAPGVPIAGPDVSSGEPVLPWLRASVALRPALLTDHYYPLSSCGYTPVVSELLSPVLREAEDSMLRKLGGIQRSSKIPLRLDETNNISCKGEPGVSDSFASALWAVDYTARAMTAGIRGVNFHDLIRVPGAYSPLVARAKRLHANPEWYALLLTQRLQGARPLRATVSSTAALTARAFLGPRGVVQLVLVNFEPPGSTPLLVHLHVPGQFAGGSILRLTGPSPYATAHVDLGGREVSASGAWSPRLPLAGVYHRHRSLELAVPPDSAALVALDPQQPAR